MMCSAMDANQPRSGERPQSRPAQNKTVPHAEDECTHLIEETLRAFFGALSLSAPPALHPTPLLLAVSGGADSLCMANAIITLRHELGVSPIVAHLDHQLRGDAAEADASFVRAFATQLGIACIVEHVDVAEIARVQRVSIEVAAREARYRFLASAARSMSAPYIAVAHNADDQAETVLLRLLRGTGINGLRGMRPVSPVNESSASTGGLTLLRPLLSVSRNQIECYCREKHLTPRHDVTNDEMHHTRNRIRHELLPLLEQYNPGIRKVLTRLAETATTDMETIDYATQKALDDLLRSEPGQPLTSQPLTLDRVAWRALPVGLQRATLREAVRRLKHDLTDLKYAGVEEARDVLNSDARTGEIAILDDVRIIVHAQVFSIVQAVQASSSYN